MQKGAHIILELASHLSLVSFDAALCLLRARLTQTKTWAGRAEAVTDKYYWTQSLQEAFGGGLGACGAFGGRWEVPNLMEP